MIGLRTGDPLDQGRRPVALAVPMHVGAQPFEQPPEIAPGEGLVQSAQVGLGLGEKLRGVEVA